MSATTLADRFTALTSAQRVRLMRRLVEAGQLEAIPALVPPREGDGPVWLSPAQEDLWVYQSLYPGSAALNLCVAYHFDGPVDPEHLETALTLVQDDHDVLRTRITGELGDLRVDSPRAGQFQLERVDLRGTGITLAESMTELRSRPFDLGRDRLVRGRFATVDDARATLMLSLHHIVTDWWSFDVLHTALAEAYLAVRDGTAPRRQRPSIQYADFACWQRELAAAGVFDARLAFWRRYLADPPGQLAVPGAPAAPSEGIAQIAFRLDPATTATLRAFARARGVTVYAVLMSAFAVFAHRLTGADDLVIGTPFANRAATGLARVIGYVMNAVPTRWRFDPGDSFADVLRRFTAGFPELLAHADLPVGRIVSAVAPEREAGRSPLFQWLFMYLTRQESVDRLRAFAEPERIHTGGEHDLLAAVREDDDGLAASFEVRTDRYDPATVGYWVESFTALLGRLVAAPDAPVGNHDLLTEAERHRLVGQHGTNPAPQTLPGLLARQAARTPDAVAMESKREALTYAALTDRVARLASRLANHGAGPERIVALALDDPADVVAAALAVQWTGAAYLPLDPDYPADRIGFMLADAAPVLLVTDAATAPALPDVEVPRLLLDEQPYATDPLAPRAVEPGHAAYVIYTSGSTGRPKGVVVSHSGIAALTESTVRMFGLDGRSRILRLSSPAFDISVAELCMAFGAGGTLVVPPARPLAGAALADVLTAGRITLAQLTPSVLASVPAGVYPALRGLSVVAETIPPELVSKWSAGGRQIRNGYGPTEATVNATYSDALPSDGTVPPIGRPVAGTRVYVLDACLRPVPVGVAGELYLAGAGLARGYLGRPGLTGERFVADPYGPAGARMYRTGDLARWRDDGQLDFLGRTDDQLKVRGLRIEPGEIEAVLAGHPSVARAVVTLHERQLVGYTVAAPGEVADPEVLRRYAAAALPAAMVPTALVPLPELPLTPGGKLDRAALPAPTGLPPTAGRAPSGPREEALCAFFTELLAAPAGPDDDFFRLGGDSIGAIQLAGRALGAGLALRPQDVFTARTPANLALLAGSASPPEPEPDAGVGRFPLTPVMRWWRELGGDPAAFVMSALFRTPTGASLDRVAAAVATLRQRHGALRLRLVPADTDAELEIGPPDELAAEPVRRVDATGMDDAALARAARTEAARVRLAPEAGDVLRAVWFDAGPARAGRLLLAVHHLAIDVVSWRLLGPQLAALLDAGPEPSPGGAQDAIAEPVGTSFRRWAELLSTAAATAEGELPYWKRALAGPDARLAPDRDLPLSSSVRATRTVELPAHLTEPVLERIPAVFHCGPDAVLLTALTAAAVRWRGTGTALLLQREGHGREGLSENVDVSATVGWFTTMYPVRLDPGEAAAEAFWRAGPETAAALKRVKEQLRAVPAGGLGWGLLRYLNPGTAAQLAGWPVPDLRFNYLGRVTDADPAGAELLGVTEAGLPLAHAVEVDAVAEQRTGGLQLVTTWSYPAGGFDEREIDRLAQLWSEALTVLAAHAEREGAGGFTASDFPLVDLTEDQLATLEADL